MAMPVPVTVVTGFLGAGKTTLVNRWLAADAAAKRTGDTAVIVNEYGAIGIDADLIDARVRTIVEIAGGCVCCSTQEELARALDQLAASGAKRILVETSGAASPAGVLRVIGGRESCVLDGVITVVDGARLDKVLDDHELAIEQIGYADIVIVSRADLADANIGRLVDHNGAAVVVRSKGGHIEGLGDEEDDNSLDALLGRRQADFITMNEPRVAKDEPHRHHHAYESISLAQDRDLDGDRFAGFMETELARFAGRILRTKGILAIAGLDRRMIVQGVADQAEITFGKEWGTSARTSRLVIVGFGLDGDALTTAFRMCAIS